MILPRQTYGYFLRSPHAHARIGSIDTSDAMKMPGVVAIFTGRDIAESKIGGLPCGWLIHSRDGSPMKEPPHPIIAADKVLHVGDQVALVVAESALQAKDAAEAIVVDLPYYRFEFVRFVGCVYQLVCACLVGWLFS